MSHTTVAGFLLKVGRQFVCYHPHKATWFLGPRRQSEVFPGFFPHKTERLSTALRHAMLLFPSAVVVYEAAT